MQDTYTDPTLGPCIFGGESDLSLAKPQDSMECFLEEETNIQS